MQCISVIEFWTGDDVLNLNVKDYCVLLQVRLMLEASRLKHHAYRHHAMRASSYEGEALRLPHVDARVRYKGESITRRVGGEG